MAELPQEARLFKGPTRERARRALVAAIEGALRDDKKIVSVQKLKAAGSKDQNCTTTMLRLWRGGLSMADSWDDPATVPSVPAPPPRDGSRDEEAGELVGLIQAAQTHDDLLAAGKAVALELLNGLDEKVAARLTGLLTEMRQSVKGRAQEPKDVVEAVLPVTEEARPLVEAFEGIADDERRAQVLAWVLERAEEDRRERPSLDTGGAEGAAV